MHGAEIFANSTDWFKDYQGFWGALIGLLGVALTLLFNAWQSRKQHQRNIKHETKSLKVAIVEELELLKEMFERRIKNLQEDPYNSAISLSLSFGVYKSLLPKIGLLKDKEIKQLIITYGYLDEMEVHFLHRCGKESVIFDNYIEINGQDKATKINVIQTKNVENIQNALKILNE